MVSFLVALVGRTMIVRQSIGGHGTARAGGGAEAPGSLARAGLIPDWSDDDRAAAEALSCGCLTIPRLSYVRPWPMCSQAAPTRRPSLYRRWRSTRPRSRDPFLNILRF